MVYQIPLYIIVSFVTTVVLSSILGFIFIKKHLRKEREREQLQKEIRRIGRSENTY